MGGQARHGEDAAGQRNREARAAAGGKAPDMQGVALRTAQQLGVIAEGVLGFGDADGGVFQTEGGHLRQLLFRFGAVFHGGGAVNLLGDGFDFLPQGHGGSGIGLSIVKAIIESMNQKYGVCNYDNGVEFWFTLDCRQ